MISVIVPVYMVEKYIRKCLDSIIAQTYFDLEIILIDDGSLDHSGSICDEYSQKDIRVKCIHTENKGLSSARNLGIQMAQGDYIGFVDPDDWIEPDMYETLLEGVEKCKADMSMCGFWVEDDSSKKETNFIDGLFIGNDSLRALLECNINTHVWNKLYRKNLFKNVKFLDNHYYEDVIILHRILAEVEKTIVISTPKYHYRQREDSIVRNQSAKYLIDYAMSYLDRYYFFQDYDYSLFKENEVKILRLAAQGISRVWRWWHKCSHNEKRSFNTVIKELKKFSKDHFPLFGYKIWPFYLKISSLFMRSSNKITFFILFYVNQLYRKIRPENANMVN